MKNLKKVFAFVIVFTMMLGLAASAGSVFPDVADDASYAEAATILSSLKIMIGDDKGNFNPDETITRAEVTAIVVRAKGLEPAANGARGATNFSDVAENHWATGYINLAAQSGIIDGFTDGTFRPEDPVTYEQAVKMVVAALGHTPRAEVNGGYPTGYLVIASQERINNGAAGQAGEPAKRAIVARLMFNALDVKLMEQTSFTAGAPEYGIVDKTLLKNNLDVDKYEGVITDTFLTSGKKADDEGITINYNYLNGVSLNRYETETFVKGETAAERLFGHYVVAYATEDERTNELTLLAVAPKTGRNNVVTVDYNQIEDVTLDEGTVSGTLEYFAKDTDNITTKLDIDAKGNLYYNGRTTSYRQVMDFLEDPQSGSVKLIDYNNDDVYEFVLVTEYTSDTVVKSVNKDTKIIESKDGNTVDIDVDDEDIITQFYMADGTPATFDDIQANDVLTLVVSDDRALVVVYISRNVVEGKVVEERPTSSGASYRIGDGYYRIAMAEGGIPQASVSVNDEGIFYLNLDNRIVYKEASAAMGNYGYLYTAGVESGIGGNKVEVKFLTSNGEWKIYELANRVTVYENGNSRSVTVIPASNDSSEDIGSNFITVTRDGEGKIKLDKMVPQLFMYNVNSSGLINRIDLATGSNRDGFSLDRTVEEGFYSESSNRIGSIFLQSDILVFSVPAEGEEAHDEEDITLTKASSIFKDGNPYTVKAYDVTDGYPRVIVAYGATADIAVETRLLVLTRVTNATRNGTPITRLYGLQKGNEVSGETTEDEPEVTDRNGDVIEGFTASDLKAGDVVIFNTNAKGEIDKIRVLMSIDEARSNAVNGYDGDSSVNDIIDYTQDAFGFVGRKENGRLTLYPSIEDAKAYRNALTDSYGSELIIDGANLNGATVYEVNLNRSEPIVNAISFGRINADTREDRVGYWLYARLYDGAIVDLVAYSRTNEVPAANKTALNAKIAEADALVATDYESGWDAFQTALTAAKAVKNDAKATQAQVNTALTNLTNAMDALVLAEAEEPGDEV